MMKKMKENGGDTGKNTMNTKVNEPKGNQIFIKKHLPFFVTIVSFYRVEIVEKPGQRGALGERQFAGCVPPFYVFCLFVSVVRAVDRRI